MHIIQKIKNLIDGLSAAEDHPGRKVEDDDKNGIITWLLSKTTMDEWIAKRAADYFEATVGDFVDNTLSPAMEEFVDSVQKHAAKVGDEFRDDLEEIYDDAFNIIIEPLLLFAVHSLRKQLEDKYPQLGGTNVDDGIFLIINTHIRGLSDIVQKALEDDEQP